MDIVQLAASQADLLAEPGTGGLRQWMQDNVISALILCAGAVALFSGMTGRISKVVTIIGGSVLALTLVVLGTGNTWESIGEWVVGLFGFN